MSKFADPRFFAGVLALAFGVNSVLGNRPGAAVRGAGSGTLPPRRLAGDTAQGMSSADLLAYQMRNPDGIVTAAYTQDDPRAMRDRAVPAYVDMIRRSIAANTPLSGGSADAVAGTGADLGAGLAPLAVLDRINALDEQWGAALESYRRTFPPPPRTVPQTVTYTRQDGFANQITWRASDGRTFSTPELMAQQTTTPGTRYVWLNSSGRPIDNFVLSSMDVIDTQVRAVQVTTPTQITLDYFPARLAAIRATVEALVFARDVLRPWNAVIMDDTTGKLTADWVAYLSTYQVTKQDLEAMASVIQAQSAPRASGFDSFLALLGTGISFVMGGVNLIGGVQSYAQQLGSAAAIDVGAAATTAGNLVNDALNLYGAGVRIMSRGPDGGADGADFAPAPVAPEEARMLQFLSQNPHSPRPLQYTVRARQLGTVQTRSDAVLGSYLRGLGGGGLYLRTGFDRMGGWEGLTAALQASGTVQGSAGLANIPGGLALKAVLLSRRAPIVIAGSFSDYYLPRVGALSRI